MGDKWTYSFDEEHYTGKFDSREEAIKEAKEIDEDYKGNAEGRFWVGKVQKVFPSGVQIDTILEDVAENTAVNSSSYPEYGQGYLDYVDSEHVRELEQSLNDVLFSWMDKHKYNPDWFEVVDVEEVCLGGK